MKNFSGTLRLGARGSLLSRRQSELVARALEAAHPGLKVELVIVPTSGDRIQDKPLHAFGGKGLFTKELEEALLRGEVDFAVHSFKDVPVTMPLVDVSELAIAAVPEREDARDVMVSTDGSGLAAQAEGARIGTSSLRRQAQVLARRPDVRVMPLRGNIDTRIRKMKSGEYDAIILALAGVERAGLHDRGIMVPMPLDEMLPAAAQGALALQCLRDRAEVRGVLGKLNHVPTAQCVAVEREVVKLLEGDCHSPIAAHAVMENGGMRLSAAVAAAGGVPPVVRASATVEVQQVETAALRVVEQLLAQGARELLHGKHGG
jgi:hydroxymethylbilane synthase